MNLPVVSSQPTTSATASDAVVKRTSSSSSSSSELVPSHEVIFGFDERIHLVVFLTDEKFRIFYRVLGAGYFFILATATVDMAPAPAS